MLIEKEVPKEFWLEAVNWTVHLMNCSPTLAVKDQTPEDAWSGHKPSMEHFKVFGCIGYVHISNQKRTKFDDKSIKCMHLGLSSESKAYRMYNPATKKILISRDVVFAENESWEWNKNGAEARDGVLDWGDNEDSENDEEAGEAEADATGDNEGTQNSSSNEVNTELVSGSSSSSSSESQGRIRRQLGG